MLEYDIGATDDNKKAVASIVDKLFDRHVFQTLRTQMQVWSTFSLLRCHCTLAAYT